MIAWAVRAWRFLRRVSLRCAPRRPATWRQLADLVAAAHPGAYTVAMNDAAQLAKLSPTGTWRRGAFEARSRLPRSFSRSGADARCERIGGARRHRRRAVQQGENRRAPGGRRGQAASLRRGAQAKLGATLAFTIRKRLVWWSSPCLTPGERGRPGGRCCVIAASAAGAAGRGRARAVPAPTHCASVTRAAAPPLNGGAAR